MLAHGMAIASLAFLAGAVWGVWLLCLLKAEAQETEGSDEVE